MERWNWSSVMYKCIKAGDAVQEGCYCFNCIFSSYYCSFIPSSYVPTSMLLLVLFVTINSIISTLVVLVPLYVLDRHVRQWNACFLAKIVLYTLLLWKWLTVTQRLMQNYHIIRKRDDWAVDTERQKDEAKYVILHNDRKWVFLETKWNIDSWKFPFDSY